MNNRLAISCATCNQGIVLRIGLGTQKIQIIAIQCPECHQKIAIELSINKSSIPYQPKYNILENCTFTTEEDSFIAINLHTEMVYPKELINEKVLMPAMTVAMQLREHATNKGFFNPVKSSGFFGVETLTIFDSLGGDSNLLEDWLIIKKAYSLYNSGKLDLMTNTLNNYSNFNVVYMMDNKLLHSIIYDFLKRFISPNTLLYNEIKKNFSKAKKSKKRFKEFNKYYKNELQTLYWKNYIDIFNEYFSNFSEFNRLLLNSKIELHPDEGTESIFRPTNFDKVKMFYGNAYEYTTTHLTTFACVNNILHDRDYDTFENLTLSKYVKLKKHSKATALQGNSGFKLFTDGLDSTLRNASHHKWFYIDEKDPGHLLYKSGGTGELNKISYIDYIYKSNLLIMKVAIMGMLEIKFLYKD